MLSRVTQIVRIHTTTTNRWFFWCRKSKKKILQKRNKLAYIQLTLWTYLSDVRWGNIYNFIVCSNIHKTHKLEYEVNGIHRECEKTLNRLVLNYEEDFDQITMSIERYLRRCNTSTHWWLCETRSLTIQAWWRRIVIAPSVNNKSNYSYTIIMANLNNSSWPMFESNRVWETRRGIRIWKSNQNFL